MSQPCCRSPSWILLFLGVLLSGCTLLPEQPALDRAWFLLEIPEPDMAEGASVAVELASVRVAPIVAGKGLVYRIGPYRYESDFYNEWFLSPREHVEQILRERWTQEGAPVTLVPTARGRPDAVQIDVLVSALHGDFDGAGAGNATVGLRVFVQGDRQSRLWNLERRVPMVTRSPEALVAGLSSGMAELLAELERQLQPSRPR